MPRTRIAVRTFKSLRFPTDPRPYASVAATLLTPVAFTGYVMAFWRLGADLEWFGEFFISNGLMSRWQVWFVLAALTHVASHYLNRTSRADRSATS